MPARSEPLLWVQLIGLGVLPLESLLLLLLLAGGDPGPVPALERLLCWALGVLAPLLLFWNRPPDVWSLLLVQTPLRARRMAQQQLSGLQQAPLTRAALLLFGAFSLPGLWWLDEHAAVAGELAPLSGTPRLVLLLLAALLLAVMLWQCQQVIQALLLLSRSAEQVAASRPMPQSELEQTRLCVGLPLLLLDPLPFAAPSSAGSASAPRQAAVSGPPRTASSSAGLQDAPPPDAAGAELSVPEMSPSASTVGGEPETADGDREVADPAVSASPLSPSAGEALAEPPPDTPSPEGLPPPDGAPQASSLGPVLQEPSAPPLPLQSSMPGDPDDPTEEAGTAPDPEPSSAEPDPVPAVDASVEQGSEPPAF
ncbi:MAG: low-complexity tail membrane protein [Cyanobium sp.]